jgi:hypothetical protein
MYWGKEKGSKRKKRWNVVRKERNEGERKEGGGREEGGI